MRTTEPHLNAAEIERRLLRALCSPSLGRAARARIVERLGAHEFAVFDHEVIFRALAKSPYASPRHIRDTLGARLTRLGFPDIDLEPLFALRTPPARRIATLLHRLAR